jgi:hypothetical protein
MYSICMVFYRKPPSWLELSASPGCRQRQAPLTAEISLERIPFRLRLCLSRAMRYSALPTCTQHLTRALHTLLFLADSASPVDHAKGYTEFENSPDEETQLNQRYPRAYHPEELEFLPEGEASVSVITYYLHNPSSQNSISL